MLSRRELLAQLGLAGICSALPAFAEQPPGYRLEIAPVTLELSARHRLRTVAYNGQAPGPLLRLEEGRPVTVEVTNHSDRPEVVHWHGLFLSSRQDGALEEGSPPLLPGATARYTFTPRPAGFRWYHTHTRAMGDLTRAQYSAQHGFLMIEPRHAPGQHDQEIFLALHDYEGYLLASDDGAMSPSYRVSTINGKIMGAGEPLRVKQGERVLLHVLNSSPTEVHWVALAGHRLRVIALDGNAVPMPRTAPMLRLAPGERVSALVEMDRPGVWVLGEVRRHVREAGMAVVLEYAGQTGTPQWQQPAALIWAYEDFTQQADPVSEGVIPLPLVIESRFRGHGAMEAFTLNGKTYPQPALPPLKRGQRYRLQFINRTSDAHPVHLHRHSFEVRSLGAALTGSPAPGRLLSGLIKDVVLVDPQTQAEVDFTANHPGDTLLHCHQQNHMDFGFLTLLRYAPG